MVIDGVIVNRLKVYYTEEKDGKTVIKSETMLNRFDHTADVDNVRDAAEIIANLKGITFQGIAVQKEQYL